MTERIIYCPMASYDALSGLLYVELGHLEDGMWMTVDDETMLAIKDRYPALLLLYFSKAQYEYAIRKLAPLEVNNAIRERLRVWSPRALDDVIHWLYLGERLCLTLTALGQASQVQSMETLLDKHFHQTLQTMANIVGEGRYDDLSLAEVLTLVLENEVSLINENVLASESAERANDLTEQKRCAMAVAKGRKYAQVQANILKRHGRPEYAEAPLHMSLTRGLFISPRDQRLMDHLRGQGIPFAEWSDGVVTTWRVDRIPNLEQRGKSVQVLYLDEGEFLRDLFELTSAQVEREFDERMEGPSVEGILDYLNTLHLEQVLLKLNLLRIAREKDPELVPVLEAQLKEETLALRSELGLHPSWLTEASKPGTDTIKRLISAEHEVVQNATLFLELCRRAGRSTLQSRVASILEIKKRDIARISLLAEGYS